ncbi:hypothetical protein A8L45_07945 [Veronia pacifica]|uniref:Uncharacterized protein n=1 Tax=Veronia pacifica TaxID=1080227 RepID=A0A1C3EL63_9GAMM|nr:hypothetical protein A8L45_07945 [Veronia pacifica]
MAPKANVFKIFFIGCPEFFACEEMENIDLANIFLLTHFAYLLERKMMEKLEWILLLSLSMIAVLKIVFINCECMKSLGAKG